MNKEEQVVDELDMVQAASRELKLSPQEIMRLLISASVRTGNSKYRNPSLYIRDKYAFEPVSCVKWLSDYAYMGHLSDTLWDVVRHDFLRIMESRPRPIRVVLKGSIGWGKTYLSALLTARELYELLCLRNPQTFYGLSPATHISFMNLATSATHARRIFFTTLRDMIDSSQWFLTKSRRDFDLQSYLVWPQRQVSLIPGSSSELAPLGEHLFGGIIEEANCMQVSTTSVRIRNLADREWDQAKKLHDAVWRRMESRYLRWGRIPGMLILNSSAEYPDDFLEKIAKENDPNTMVIEHSTWETKPASRFTGQKVYVFVGDNDHAPKLCKTEEEKEQWGRVGVVKEVPAEYKSDFERDLEGAVRDIIGVNVRSVSRFFPSDEKLEKMVDATIPMPFLPEYSEGVPSHELMKALLWHKFFLPPSAAEQKAGRRLTQKRHFLHPGQVRYMHIDLGLVSDATGLAVVHIGGKKPVHRRFEDVDGIYVEAVQAPVIYVDLVLRIIPPITGEIQISEVQELVFKLVDKAGFSMAKITYDQFQSKQSQQTLMQRFGDDVVGHLSVDRTADQYNVLKEVINEERLRSYGYKPMFRELRQLQYDPRTSKVDHIPSGSKDVADGLAGAVWNAITNAPLDIRTVPTKGMVDEGLSTEEKIAKDALDWLRDKPARAKELQEDDDFEKTIIVEDDEED